MTFPVSVVGGDHHGVFDDPGKGGHQVDLPELLDGGVGEKGAILFLGHIADYRRHLAAESFQLGLGLHQGILGHIAQHHFAAVLHPELGDALADSHRATRDHRYRIFDFQHGPYLRILKVKFIRFAAHPGPG